MKNFWTKGRIALLVIFSVLIVDQLIKVAVKTGMYWHDSVNAIGWLYDKLGIHAEPPTWFYIFFTENNGMAFGMEIVGKLFLTSFRIAAVAVIAWFLYKFVQHKMKTGFIVCVSLVLTGALGNIIDSVFYGVLFSESTTYSWLRSCPRVADMLPCSTERWSICSTSRLLRPIGRRGCLSSAVNISFSSALFSTLPTLPSVAASLPCCFSTANI